MIGAFTRLTNAFPVCCLVLVGMITLIRKKKYANLFRNGVAFIVGIVIVALPYIIYFVAKDALYDMVYATFIFNFKYGNDLVPAGDIIEKIKQLAYMLIPVTTLVISIYGIIKKKNIMDLKEF